MQNVGQIETFIYKNPEQKSFLKLVRDLNAIKKMLSIQYVKKQAHA